MSSDENSKFEVLKFPTQNKVARFSIDGIPIPSDTLKSVYVEDSMSKIVAEFSIEPGDHFVMRDRTTEEAESDINGETVYEKLEEKESQINDLRDQIEEKNEEIEEKQSQLEDAQEEINELQEFFSIDGEPIDRSQLELFNRMTSGELFTRHGMGWSDAENDLLDFLTYILELDLFTCSVRLRRKPSSLTNKIEVVDDPHQTFFDRFGEKWDSDEIDLLVDLIYSGDWTPMDCAIALGRRVQEIHDCLERNDVSWSETTRDREGKQWSQEEDDQFKRLWSRNVSVSEIADKLGRSEGAIRARRQTLNLRKRNEGRATGPSEEARQSRGSFWDMEVGGQTRREILKDMYENSDNSVDDIIEAMDASEDDKSKIYQMANQLGLKRR